MEKKFSAAPRRIHAVINLTILGKHNNPRTRRTTLSKARSSRAPDAAKRRRAPGGLYAYARDKEKTREARLLSLLCKCAPALRRLRRRRAGALLCTSYALCALRMNSNYTCAANRRLLFGAKKCVLCVCLPVVSGDAGRLRRRTTYESENATVSVPPDGSA